MSRVFLPIGKKAHTPYNIRPMGVEVSTLEELCYYIAREAELLDRDFMCPELIDFIAGPLGLPKLSQLLAENYNHEASLAGFCCIILAWSHFLDEDEFARAIEKLELCEECPESEKVLLKIRRLEKNREYHTLISQGRIYLADLEGKEATRENLQTCAVLCSKVAAAYAGLFYYEPAAQLYLQAAEYYEKVSDTMHTHKCVQQYLLCLRICMPEKQFRRFVEDHPKYLEASLMAEQRLARATAGADAALAALGPVNADQMESLRRDFERM